MKHIFLTVLGMSGTACAVILAVLLARLVLRKAPKAFSYALWAVVLFRLLCPVSISSPLSVVQPFQAAPDEEKVVDVWKPAASGAGTVPAVGSAPVQVSNPGAAAVPAPLPEVPDADRPETPVHALAIDLQTVAGFVWLTGAALLLGYSAVSLFLLRRRLVGAVPLAGEKNVLLADHIPSPFVLGLFRPRIYLPSGLPEGERDYIILHERTHIRRLDHITRALAWLALAVHWFNPLVWLSFHLAGKDMEMSCDEAVLRKMGRDIRADYSTSLLRLSVGGRLPAGPLAFGGGDTQTRIKNVLNYKKPAFWAAALALIAVLCTGVALGTDPSDLIDPDSVTAVFTVVHSGNNRISMSEFQGSEKFNVVPLEDGMELILLINSYGRTIYPGGSRQTLDGLDNLIRITCADGGYYLLHYWYCSGFSMFHGEDDYYTLITRYDAEGNAGLTWKMEYDFDRAYRKWLDRDIPPVQRGELRESDIVIDGLDETSLTFSMYTLENSVDIKGRLCGVELEEEDSYWSADPFPWYPDIGFEYPCGWVRLVRKDPLMASGTRGYGIYAGWTDESRTSISISTMPKHIDNYAIANGYWHFTVELSTRTVTAMEAVNSHPYYTPPDPVEMHPESVTDEEAVEMARVAAAVIRAAEDYYKRTISSVKTQSPAAASGLAATYSRFRTGYVEVGGLDCLGAFWQPATRHMWANDGMGLPEEGLLGVLCIDTPRFFGGRFAEARGSATVGYFPEENSPLVFVAFCDYVPPDSGDGRMTSDGTFFVVDLASGAVRFPEWAGYDAVDPGLSDGELASLAQALAQVIQGASDFYNSPAYEEWYALLESGGVQLCRVGDAYVEWGSSSDPDGPGSLYFAGDPLFCCTSLELIGRNVEGAAHWLDERTLRVNFTVDDERAPSTGAVAGFRIEFTVDMDSGAVTSRDFQSQVAGETLELDDVEMVGMASRLNELMKEAARFYADSTGKAGPLPLKGPMKLMLASGAGSWGSLVTLCSDGSFNGHYSRTEGETQYVCWFHGQFGDIRQASAASWSMTLEELVLDTGHPIGEEWEDPGDIFHYISSLPVGFTKEDGQGKSVALEPGAEFVLYTPEASSKPGGELYGMEDPSSDLHDFWYWWPGSYHSTGEGDLLNCYGLRNVEGGDGFFNSWSS